MNSASSISSTTLSRTEGTSKQTPGTVSTEEQRTESRPIHASTLNSAEGDGKVRLRRTRYEKIHLDAAGGGGQLEKDRPVDTGYSSDTCTGHLPGSMGIGERHDSRM